jgi:hypothetical protein
MMKKATAAFRMLIVTFLRGQEMDPLKIRAPLRVMFGELSQLSQKEGQILQVSQRCPVQ